MTSDVDLEITDNEMDSQINYYFITEVAKEIFYKKKRRNQRLCLKELIGFFVGIVLSDQRTMKGYQYVTRFSFIENKTINVFINWNVWTLQRWRGSEQWIGESREEHNE